LIVYDDAVENEHKVEKHRGNRRTLLMFFRKRVKMLLKQVSTFI